MTTLDLNQQANAAHQWWRALQPREIPGGAKLTGDRATLARLRRSSSPFEAAAEPETIKLCKKLGFTNPEKNLGRAAVLAAVLAHVRETSSDRLARSLGPTMESDPSTAAYSALRLRRLLATKGDDDILIAFRRAVAILGDTANVRDLAYQILNWDRDELGDRTRTRFAFDYHSAGAYAPGAETEPTDSLSSY